MDAKILRSSISTNQGIPLLKTHLLHILDTTQLLLNLEQCTLSLTTEYGDDALCVSSSVEPASVAHAIQEAPPSPDFGSEEAFEFKQRLELGLEQIADAACMHVTHSVTPDQMSENKNSAAPAKDSVSFINLNLVRHPRFGRLTYTETYAIKRVLQSINRVIVSYFDYRSHDYYASMLERLLAHFCIGVINLSPKLEIIEKSSLVDDLLASTTSYCCQSNRLVKIAPHDDRVLERAVEALDDNHLPYNFVDVVSTVNDGQCALVVTRLAPDREDSTGGYLIYILCSIVDHFEASDLLNFWQITPAEKRVLAGLTRYGSIKKVAIELGISPNTVKSQLKSAYKKLGVDNKISLLRRFSLLRLINALTCTG